MAKKLKKKKKDKEKDIIKYDVKNEQIILSQMMRSVKDRRRCTRELTEHFFIGKRHKVIFKVLSLMEARNLDYNEDTFDTLAADEDYGGLEYIRDLEELFEENTNLDFHLERLRTDSLKVRLRLKEAKKFNELLEDPHANEEKLTECINEINNKIKLTYTPAIIVKGKDLKKSYFDILKERQKTGTFVSTGFNNLDKFLTEGFAPGKVSTLAARPSMGKSTVIANLVRRLVNKRKILVAPLEVGRNSFMDAMICSATGIETDRIIKNTKELTKEEKEEIVEATSKLVDNENLQIVDDTTLTVNKFGALLESSNFEIAILDLFDNLYDIDFEPKKMIKQLKTIQDFAKRSNTHIMLVNQIRRDVEKAKDKRPTLNTLKNSGGFEEVSDLILFLHREKYYNALIERDIIEFIIAKQRFGVRNKTVYYEFHGNKLKIGRHVTDYNPHEEMEVF